MSGETVPIEIWKQVNRLTRERDAALELRTERLDQQRALALEEAALHLEDAGPDCHCGNINPNTTASEIRALGPLRRGLVAVPACHICQLPLMGPGGEFCSGDHNWRTQMTPEIEKSIRTRLWLSHGHVGMYGDDGEMQCAECLPYGVSDYKRQSLGELLDGLNTLGLDRVAKLARTENGR